MSGNGTAPGPWPANQSGHPSNAAKRRAAAPLALILLATMLVSCGKKGMPDPPGPPDQITYPRIYPTR